MKLIFTQYLADLKERGELDAILPDLLSGVWNDSPFTARARNETVRCRRGSSRTLRQW